MKSAEIRNKFLEYFKKNGHTIVPSSSLIPQNDPTLLFTNAGMVQFKDVFLGLQTQEFSRAASAQRCVRAGGKHNDLENVGYTARHHTLFEMLGNFSFGDYGKREAIEFAWEFLTKELKIPAQKLWITVFEEDQQAEDIWLKHIKVDPKRFSRCGEKDNFWAMGETGPCGPCTEIFYDHGEGIFGDPPGGKNADGDRYVEVWNLVFMQYERDNSGKMKPLPKLSVDTGMGLERISAVMQGVQNNFDTDLFTPLIKALDRIIKESKLALLDNLVSKRVIADHIRSCSFLIADGVIPSNEGRGYVLRRIIRRALRHGHKLGFSQPFFHRLVATLCQQMGEFYPVLMKNETLIEKMIKEEEENFIHTLQQGLDILAREISSLKNQIIPGEFAFKLYDTYGFPLDLTADIARERHLTVDETGFHQAMQQQRERSKAAQQFKASYHKTEGLDVETIFIGYENLVQITAVKALFKEDQAVEQLSAGDMGIIALETTPFYAESGGQVGDQGEIIIPNRARFVVQDTQKQGQTILHFGKLIFGNLKLHDQVSAEVNPEKRRDTAYNHSATHLLNAALRQILGDHILQKGSLVEPERLRFDFSHFEALHPQQIQQIEDLVNQKIRENLLVETKIMTAEEAMDSGAIALFGEKYGAEVRVLCMGDFSMELCGGTHVQRTGDIGFFKIITECGIAAGIRRIEAITGRHALEWVRMQTGYLQMLADTLKVPAEQLPQKIQQQMKIIKDLEKEVQKLKQKLISNTSAAIFEETKTIADIEVLLKQINDLDNESMRKMLDQLKQQHTNAVIVLASENNGKIQLVTGTSKKLSKKMHAGDLVNFLAAQLGGRGGGRPDMAMGAGNLTPNLPHTLQSTYQWVKERI